MAGLQKKGSGEAGHQDSLGKRVVRKAERIKEWSRDRRAGRRLLEPEVLPAHLFLFLLFRFIQPTFQWNALQRTAMRVHLDCRQQMCQGWEQPLACRGAHLPVVANTTKEGATSELCPGSNNSYPWSISNKGNLSANHRASKPMNQSRNMVHIKLDGACVSVSINSSW